VPGQAHDRLLGNLWPLSQAGNERVAEIMPAVAYSGSGAGIFPGFLPFSNRFVETKWSYPFRYPIRNFFVSLDDARNKIEKWRVEYNRERPHSRLGNLTPEEFAAKHQMSSAIARTAWPAAEPELADAVQRAPASDPKLDRFPTALRS
jgi:putative transposase